MIGSTRQLSVFAHPEPVDMRKGFDGLGALVVSGLGRDPLSGDLFLFVSRDRERATFCLLRARDSAGVVFCCPVES